MRFSPLVDRIAGEGSRAWDIHFQAVERQRRGEEVILLSVGDPDFRTPQPIVERAIESLQAGRTRYTPINGEPELRAAIARWHERLTGLAIDPAEVVVTAGAQNGLFLSALCLLAPGDEVIVPVPMYVTYEAVFATTGARAVTIPSAAEKGFHPDPAAIAAAVTERTRAIYINTPHNPTGAVFTRAELEAIAEICREHNLWLVCDEVYAALTFEGEHISPCALPGMAERTVVVSSLSKSHSMPGWRAGWMIAPSGLAAHAHNLLLCSLYGLPGFVQDAARHALEAAGEDLAAMRARYRARRDLICDALAAAPGLLARKPEGGMFVMIDVRGTGLGAQAFAQALLDRYAVSVLPGEGFGAAAAGHLRLSLTASEEVLAEACRRIVALATTVAAEQDAAN
ncbi:pyridoxal phosphate-dependent aminotransferase [Aquibaculum arenosum]|uniref:Aminotransferase n=1 Tax=Aquibaculum arenosum TaxID=3032591 RepID=A0ABT5YHH3_9PROT|nr:pyridoxal phosphate-dependent aminotransferase [Fodinicurvata sp. CAU 1616]MDF2094395.1 pyridoxal phosphate-dependent aminotransferase [Fodinicurvata sp. CAU 1616]